MIVVTKNIKFELTHHQRIHLKNKLFRCNDRNDCSFETNFRYILVNHIKTKHTRQDFIKCSQPGCEKEFTERNLKKHTKNVHEDVRKYKCEVEGRSFATKRIANFNRHIK